MVFNKAASLFTLLCATASTGLFASDKSFFIGAATTLSGYDDNDNQTYKINAGYKFNKYFSGELSHLDLGEKDGYDGTGDLAASAYSLGMIAQYPINQWSIYGKLGILNWSQDGVIITPSDKTNISESGVDISYGVGVNYRLYQHLSIKTEVESVKVNDDSDILLALGFDIHF